MPISYTNHLFDMAFVGELTDIQNDSETSK